VTQPLALRAGAEALASPFPPLLAQAEHLASTVILGDHGRRRAGLGDNFWQYRPATQSDEARAIDWRRSGRSDTAYVQDKEWQVAQSISVWVDLSASMEFSSTKDLETKSQRARLIALAAAVLMLRGGERVGLAGPELPSRRGTGQAMRLAQLLSSAGVSDVDAPQTSGLLPHSRALFVSDFLGNFEAVETALLTAADRGVTGALLQVLDPQEESFPFNGRTIFESMGGALRHETLRAGDLRAAYLDRLAERKERLAYLARMTGWQFHTHHTDSNPSSALLWLYSGLGRH